MNMNFGEAIEYMKQGRKMRRSGWNGKNMHIVVMPGYESIPANIPAADAMGVPVGSPITVGPYLMMKDAQGRMVIGWLASQTDLLADDWEVADPK